MKKCILIHVNDAKEEVLHDKDFLYVERFPKTEKIIEDYLSKGYEVKQIIPSYAPSTQKEGNYTFYVSGITIYFEKVELD